MPHPSRRCPSTALPRLEPGGAGRGEVPGALPAPTGVVPSGRAPPSLTGHGAARRRRSAASPWQQRFERRAQPRAHSQPIGRGEKGGWGASAGERPIRGLLWCGGGAGESSREWRGYRPRLCRCDWLMLTPITSWFPPAAGAGSRGDGGRSVVAAVGVMRVLVPGVPFPVSQARCPVPSVPIPLRAANRGRGSAAASRRAPAEGPRWDLSLSLQARTGGGAGSSGWPRGRSGALSWECCA